MVGYVHPQKIITNSGAIPGDSLILTKPVGTGVILAGQRLGLTGKNDVPEALRQMKLLNRSGADVMKKFNVRGATDITGFGLAGHVLKMAKASNVTIVLNMTSVPLIGDTYRLLDEGCIPGASFRNLDYAEKDTMFDKDLDYNLKMAAFDAQTSGGLLISVPQNSEEEFMESLKESGITTASVVGKVLEFGAKYLILKN